MVCGFDRASRSDTLLPIQSSNTTFRTTTEAHQNRLTTPHQAPVIPIPKESSGRGQRPPRGPPTDRRPQKGLVLGAWPRYSTASRRPSEAAAALCACYMPQVSRHLSAAVLSQPRAARQQNELQGLGSTMLMVLRPQRGESDHRSRPSTLLPAPAHDTTLGSMLRATLDSHGPSHGQLLAP